MPNGVRLGPKPTKLYWLDYEEEAHEVITSNLLVEDSSYEYSGLLDAKGDPLVYYKEPIGFKFKD